ncbi:MAG: hypothetical protein IJS15_03200 [Victivallales bacterium]|nr:hypothetical protein [Victivallales bacterium]
MDIGNIVFEWIIILVGGATVVFALAVILSLVFDGFLDKISSLFKKGPRK